MSQKAEPYYCSRFRKHHIEHEVEKQYIYLIIRIRKRICNKKVNPQDDECEDEEKKESQKRTHTYKDGVDEGVVVVSGVDETARKTDTNEIFESRASGWRTAV